MKKEMHPTTVATYAVIVKYFKPGQPLSYSFIGGKLGNAGETARKHAIRLAKKRLVSIKKGHIVGVK